MAQVSKTDAKEDSDMTKDNNRMQEILSRTLEIAKRLNASNYINDVAERNKRMLLKEGRGL